MNKIKSLLIFVSLTLVTVVVYQWGHLDGRQGKTSGLIDESFAAEKSTEVSPTHARDRDVYYPNSENLAPDEMRVIACGTGMPTTRGAQAAACFLVELGNGDKFIFDIGSGSAERISSLQIPYDYLDKILSDTCIQIISVHWLKCLSEVP